METSPAGDHRGFLCVGGELDALGRAKGWSAPPLAPPDRVGAFKTSLWPDLVETAFVLPLGAPSQAASAAFLVPVSVRAASWTQVVAASSTRSRSPP